MNALSPLCDQMCAEQSGAETAAGLAALRVAMAEGFKASDAASLFLEGVERYMHPQVSGRVRGLELKGDEDFDGISWKKTRS